MNIFLAVIGAVLVGVGTTYFFKAWRRTSVPRFDAVGFDAALAVSFIGFFAGLLPLALGLIGIVRAL